MTVAVEADRLGKRYGRAWGLQECSLRIPAGRVVALIGPNGAGKTTLLQLMVGLLAPTTGRLEILGSSPRKNPVAVISRVGFLAQDHPMYPRFAVADMLEMGRRLNRSWDRTLAENRLKRLRIPLDRQIRQLSGGQQAQVALTLALAKRPEMLLLDEPAASLDPLARRQFLAELTEAAQTDRITVILSSHVMSELERTCDHLVILNQGRVQLAGDVDAVLSDHRVVTGPPIDQSETTAHPAVIQAEHSNHQSVLVVRRDFPVPDSRWQVREIPLEELVLAYLSNPAFSAAAQSQNAQQRGIQ